MTFIARVPYAILLYYRLLNIDIAALALDNEMCGIAPRVSDGNGYRPFAPKACRRMSVQRGPQATPVL